MNEQAITQEFSIEILATNVDGVEHAIAPALASAVTAWEREFPEEQEDDDDGFVVVGKEGSVQEDDSDDGDEDENEEGDEDENDEDDSILEEPSDSSLNLTVVVTPAVLSDIKAIQSMDVDERLRVRIIYGSGLLVRQFSIAPDLGLIFSSGEKVNAPLHITLVADIFDTEIIF